VSWGYEDGGYKIPGLLSVARKTCRPTAQTPPGFLPIVKMKWSLRFRYWTTCAIASWSRSARTCSKDGSGDMRMMWQTMDAFALPGTRRPAPGSARRCLKQSIAACPAHSARPSDSTMKSQQMQPVVQTEQCTSSLCSALPLILRMGRKWSGALGQALHTAPWQRTCLRQAPWQHTHESCTTCQGIRPPNSSRLGSRGMKQLLTIENAS